MQGHRSSPADIVIWETQEARAANKMPGGMVACKAENVEFQHAV